MVSFEGVRQGTGNPATGPRLNGHVSLYLAGLAAILAVLIGLGLPANGGRHSAASPTGGSPYPSLRTEVVPDLGELLLLARLPETFTTALPTAFTDNFDVPAPPPAPAQAEPEPEAAAPPVSRPVTTAPAATAPVEQPKPAPPPPPAPAEKPNFYLPDVSAGGITALEQRLFDGINAQRSAAGLAAYSYDAGLSKIARIRAQQMADQGYFAHVDPHGYSMYTELLARFGYSYAWAGENLALNNYNVSESPERAIISLMKSPTHAANILAGDFFRVGIGEVSLPDGRHIYAMIFLG